MQLTCAMAYRCDEYASILYPFYLKQDSIQQVLSLVISVNFLLHTWVWQGKGILWIVVKAFLLLIPSYLSIAHNVSEKLSQLSIWFTVSNGPKSFLKMSKACGAPKYTEEIHLGKKYYLTSKQLELLPNTEQTGSVF